MDEEAASSIAPAFERLLQDPEAEVRTAAAGNLTAVARHLPREMVGVYVWVVELACMWIGCRYCCAVAQP